MEHSDVNDILSHRHENGADYWATPDGRIYVGNPFSTISSLLMLNDLGVGPDHEAVRGGLDLILGACREDGRIQIGPKAPLYPCYTAEAARVLCRYSHTESEVLQRTVSYFLENVHEKGGWRCNFSRFGKGPETEYANPGATLYALDALRFFPEFQSGVASIDRAIAFLLDHWDSRKPLGPCHWGIGTLFLQVEYPFLRYNIFFYVYVLSFYEYAIADDRFMAAYNTLSSKLNNEEEIIVERQHRGLKGLVFCERGRPSAVATRRFAEIRQNLSD